MGKRGRSPASSASSISVNTEVSVSSAEEVDKDVKKATGLPPPPPEFTELTSDNVKKLGTTKAEPSKKSRSDHEEVADYMKAAKERLKAWEVQNPDVPTEGKSAVTTEFNRLLQEKFAKSVSSRGVSLLGNILDETCLEPKHAVEVAEILRARVVKTHDHWDRCVSDRRGEEAATRMLLQDWYLIDATLKHFRTREHQERKVSAAASNGGSKSGPARLRWASFVKAFTPTFKTALPRRSGLSQKEGDQFYKLLSTWRAVLPATLLEELPRY